LILGIGVDIVENERMDEKLAERILGEEELGMFRRLHPGRKIEYLASRFAAKEAFFKALGTGLNGFSFKEVQVLNDSHGKPFFSFSERMREFLEDRKIWAIHLSMSHERKYSIALVILEGKE